MNVITNALPPLSRVSNARERCKHYERCLPACRYWGDIVASPYIAWGIEAEDATLFKKNSMQVTAGHIRNGWPYP
jgi:hypothetical protein